METNWPEQNCQVLTLKITYMAILVSVSKVLTGIPQVMHALRLGAYHPLYACCDLVPPLPNALDPSRHQLCLQSPPPPILFPPK